MQTKEPHAVPRDTRINEAIIMEDLQGENYTAVLQRLHQTLRPKTYFEIGVQSGATLALASCDSVAIDPNFNVNNRFKEILRRRVCMFFSMESDEFFASYEPDVLLRGPVDFAFLDGMHRCEFLLRDFINTERYCKPNSVIALHDCIPVEPAIADREPGLRAPFHSHRKDWWTGDVWRTGLLLKRYRSDLDITTLDASPSGLVLITKLDPASTWSKEYWQLTREMLSWDLESITPRGLCEEMHLQSSSVLKEREQITARFWL